MIEQISETQYIASNNEPFQSYHIDPNKRRSFGIVDDETSYKQIRKKLELMIRESKSSEFQRKGLDGIISISRKFQRLLDQSELLETPKYAFPLFDEIFFAFHKYGIMSDRAYNQMIVQCERREMNVRCIGILKRMIENSIRPTSYTLNFLIRCLIKGKEYDAMEELFKIWKYEGLIDKTRMEYWHLRNLLNLLIDNQRQDLILKYLIMIHDLKLLEYSENHSDLMQHKDYEIQQQIIRKICFYGVKNKEDINEWIKFFTSHWNMIHINICSAVIAKVLYWNEIECLDGMNGICTELGIDTTNIEIDSTIIASILGNMKKKSTYSIVDGLELFNYALKHHGDTFKPNISCFNQLFALIKSQNEIKIAFLLLNDIRSNYQYIKPNKESAINLIRLLYYNPTDFIDEKSGHQLLNELISMGLECNPIHQDIYHELIQLHAFYADFTGFLLTLYKMKAENQISEELVVTDTVDDEEEEHETNKIKINENTFEPIIEPILLNVLAANGDVNNCCLVLDEMIECSYRPSGPVYRDIIDNMGKYGYGQQALQMIDRAILDGMVFSDRIWRYWMLSFAKYGEIESCLLFLDKMDRSNNIKAITTRHFNGLLYAYYQNNDLNGIRKTYDYMINVTQQQNNNNKMNIKPDIKSYHIIAKTYLSNNKSSELRNLFSSMEYHDIALDWKMYSIGLRSMLNETEHISWQDIAQYVSSVISAKKVFPRQPLIDDILSASIQLNALDQGLQFIHESFDDPDVRTSTLPTEMKLAQFITQMFLTSHPLYRGMLAYLTEKYKYIYSIKEEKKYLSNFRFRAKRLIQYTLFTLNDSNIDSNIDCRQLLIDILRNLCAPIDELKAKKDLSSYSDSELLSAYYPLIEQVLNDSVKQYPNLILLSSSLLSVPIKPQLFTKMVHSLVFNGDVSTIRSLQCIIDEYYDGSAANPYINKEYNKPWLISSKTEWQFMPHQMIDKNIGIKISDLILFDALLYDKRLNEALDHLSLLHKERKISDIIIKQIVQRTINYMKQTNQLKVNDKEYVSKVINVFTQILNQMPTINNDNNYNPLFEYIWNDHGFTKGAIILQGLLTTLDKKHELKPHLQRFCVNEFSKLTQYGLLETESERERETIQPANQKHSFLAK